MADPGRRAAYYPRADWLAVPDGQPVDWQEMLQDAPDAVVAWGS